MVYIAIFIGGCLGGGFRYICTLLIQQSYFPFATLTVNVLGALLMGVFSTYLISYFKAHSNLKKLITTGFLGAFTTYSSLSLETVQLIINGKCLLAFIYVLSSMLLGFVFMAIGYKRGAVHS